MSARLTQVESLLREHFQALIASMENPAASSYLDKTDSIIGTIRGMGGTSDAAIAALTIDDLTKMGVPTLIARTIAAASQAPLTPAAPSKEGRERVVYVSDDPVTMAARLTAEELVAEYDPAHPINPIGTRLKQLTEGNKFLVFDAEGLLNVPKSQELVRELLDLYPPRTTAMVNGVLTELFAVGDRPARFGDENPIRPGQLLRPDGYSDANIDWKAVPFEIRQLLRIALEMKEIGDTSAEFYIACVMVGERKFDDVAKIFPKAAIEFTKRKGSGNLPSLRLPLQAKPSAAPAAK